MIGVALVLVVALGLAFALSLGRALFGGLDRVQVAAAPLIAPTAPAEPVQAVPAAERPLDWPLRREESQLRGAAGPVQATVYRADPGVVCD